MFVLLLLLLQVRGVRGRRTEERGAGRVVVALVVRGGGALHEMLKAHGEVLLALVGGERAPEGLDAVDAVLQRQRGREARILAVLLLLQLRRAPRLHTWRGVWRCAAEGAAGGGRARARTGARACSQATVGCIRVARQRQGAARGARRAACRQTANERSSGAAGERGAALRAGERTSADVGVPSGLPLAAALPTLAFFFALAAFLPFLPGGIARRTFTRPAAAESWTYCTGDTHTSTARRCPPACAARDAVRYRADSTTRPEESRLRPRSCARDSMTATPQTNRSSTSVTLARVLRAGRHAASPRAGPRARSNAAGSCGAATLARSALRAKQSRNNK